MAFLVFLELVAVDLHFNGQSLRIPAKLYAHLIIFGYGGLSDIHNFFCTSAQKNT